jgi:signal transduction histidine kinase/ligand-binding sensor domain-containing protein
LKTTINILALLLFIFLTHQGYSRQEMRFEHITVQDGLPENSVRQILQDYQGFLWLATQNGLVKYDGYKLTVFNYDPLDSHSLGGRFIFSIYEDKAKDIWIGTEFGLSKYDRKKNWFENFSLDGKVTSVYSYSIYTICEDNFGQLYFGSLGTGLFKFDKTKKSYTKFLHDPNDSNSIASNSINGVFTFDSSTIWIGTTDEGLCKFNVKDQTFKNYKIVANDTNSKSRNFVFSMAKDRKGILWIGTTHELFKFNELTETFTAQTISGGDSLASGDYEISNIYEDKRGILWLAIFNYGLVKFEPGTGEFCRYKNDPSNEYSLRMNFVSSAYEDRTGVFWVGTFWGGLHKYDMRKSEFSHFKPNTNEYSRNNYVETLIEDSTGAIWVGTYNSLKRFDRSNQSFTDFANIFSIDEDLQTKRIESLYMDNQDIFWIGTDDGLIMYNKKKKTNSVFRHITDDSTSISGNFISEIYEDRDSNLWIGTLKGLNLYDRNHNSFKVFRYDKDDSNSLSQDEVLCIYQDRFDGLWIGTNWGGLNKFDKISGTFDRYYYPKLGFTCISSLAEENTGNLWIGTYNTGMCLFDIKTGAVKFVMEKERLINNTIVSTIKDDTGNLWSGTDNGLTRFNPETKSIKNFDKNDLPFTRFLQGALKDRAGYLYFGGQDGFIMFHPDSIKDNEHVPEIVLTEFMMFNKAVKPDDDSPLKENINVADEIILTYEQNSFSFEFAALDYTNPGSNKYAYMMTGFDKDWIHSGNVRTAYYTNLDPGEYVFHAKGSNNDGVWNEKGASVRVIITPPWWKTWWFRGCGMVLLLGLLGYVRQKKLSKIKNELTRQSEFTKQLINTQEAERKRIAGELHDSLGQKLLIIKNKLLSEMKSQKDNSRLNELSGLTSDTLQEVRNISYNLHPYQLEQLGLTKAIESILKSVSDAGKINFRADIDKIDSVFHQQSEINIYRVIQECMNNILKHSSASEVDISIKKKDNILSIHVFDNGKGFISEDHQNIKEGRGIGLMGISERVKLLDGKFDIESSYGKGTRIQIDIPY